jgi:C-terminal processing protease CtpA/Prc
VVRNYFNEELIVTGEGRIEYGIIQGNIGYIYMATFDDDYLMKYFSEVLGYVKNTKAIILDIRHNNGGSSGSTSSAPAEYTLPSGNTIFVGTTDWRRYDGLPYEWIGVPPDILVQQTREDIENGRDNQLEYAINMLK